MSITSFTFTPDDGVPPGVAPFAHATALVEIDWVAWRADGWASYLQGRVA